MVFGKEPVLADVFACNQRQPSICYEELEQVDNESPILGSGLGPTINPMPQAQGLTLWWSY
jgi:hypothetical protein